MILGLSHIGITVDDMEKTLSYYNNVLGFNVLDDSERKGEWVEKITGIPGFHTRNVYVAVSRHNHLELFKFYHPVAIPPENHKIFQVGISYCALLRAGLENLLESTEAVKNQLLYHAIIDYEQEPCPGGRSVELMDPNFVKLKAIQPKEADFTQHEFPSDILLYASLTVQDIGYSIKFYRDTLGLELTHEGESKRRNDREYRERWALLKFLDCTWLKLVQPLGAEIVPAKPWRMQEVGITHIAFAVSDLDKYYQELNKKHVNFNSSPQLVTIGPHKGGKIVYLTTPEGIIIEFIDSPLTLNHLISK